MGSILNVTANQISKINSSTRLVQLLNRLIHAEARANGIARSGILIPAQITVSDAGEDARVEWRDGPAHTDYFPARVTTFQSKATRMPRSKCAAEVCDASGALKSAIRDALNSNGAYIIFCTDSCRGEMLRERIDGIRDGIRNATNNQFPGALINFYDANKIRDWVNSHPSVAAWALTELFGRSVSGLQSWESWSRNPDLRAEQ